MPDTTTSTIQKTISRELDMFFRNHSLYTIKKALLETDNTNNYFDFSIEDKTKISYLRNGRIPEKEALIFDPEYRKSMGYHARIGKLLNKSKYDQDEYQRACRMLYLRGHQHNIVITDRICDHYHEDNYYSQSGELGNSCMRHDGHQHIIEFYEALGANVVRLAVILDENQGSVLARGLLWQNVKVIRRSGQLEYTRFLDRVYAVDSNIASALYAWADSLGIPSYKKYPKDCEELLVDIPAHARDTSAALPYFDTFRHTDDRLSYLSSYSGSYELCETEGISLEDMTRGNYVCASCGDHMHEDNAYYCDDDQYYCPECSVYSEYYGKTIPKHDARYSESAETWFYEDESAFVYSDYEGDYLKRADAVYCEKEEEYIFIDNAVYLHNGTYTAPEFSVEYNGEYYHKDDCAFDEEAQRLIPCAELIEN